MVASNDAAARLEQNQLSDGVSRESEDKNFSSSLSRSSHGEWYDHGKAKPKISSRSHRRTTSHYSGLITNEPLIDGFSLLRLATLLLNPDIYYIGQVQAEENLQDNNDGSQNVNPTEHENKSLENVVISSWQSTEAESVFEGANNIMHTQGRQESNSDLAASVVPSEVPSVGKPNILEEVASLKLFKYCLNSSNFISNVIRLLTICLSLLAIMISVDKTISTILLCLFSRSDIKRQSATTGRPSMPYEASDVSMGWFVLILVNLSSTYIIFSTVFNGHLLWNLLSQRLFLVCRRFQFKVMLSLLVFVYLEYILNISFINNLFGWSFVSDDIESNGKSSSNGIHNSYSILSRLEIFVTDKDDTNDFSDILLTIIQFSRGAIRISPYITINYVIICLSEHIETIRNQTLLTDSLKKKQKLRLVMKSSKAPSGSRGAQTARISADRTKMDGAFSNGLINGRNKKRVIFATDTSATNNIGNSYDRSDNSKPLRQLQLVNSSANGDTAVRDLSPSPISSILSENKDMALNDASTFGIRLVDGVNDNSRERKTSDSEPEKSQYCDRIKDFNELESHITNLYIFTGRLNRLMSRQGLAMFFIVHNLVISCSLIVPEAIRGGPPMVYFIRALVILIGIVPFRWGQYLNGQLEQLSKQIDRIIIHQQFFGRRRDNLVRIRELLHDIRVDCAGMLNFNIETGLKYLVIAFASAFFIEQEDYKLTRRH